MSYRITVQSKKREELKRIRVTGRYLFHTLVLHIAWSGWTLDLISDCHPGNMTEGLMPFTAHEH